MNYFAENFNNFFIIGVSIIGIIFLYHPIMYPKRQKINHLSTNEKYTTTIIQEGAAVIIQKAYRKYVAKIIFNRELNRNQ